MLALRRSPKDNVVDTSHPQLKPNVEVLEPMTHDAPWIVRQGTGNAFRVSEAFGTIAQSMDGSRSLPEIADAVQVRCTEVDVARVVDQLASRSLLGASSKSTKIHRVKFVRPFTLQFALVKEPYRVLRLALPLLRIMAHPIARVAGVVLVLAGFGALLTQSGALRSVAAQPTEMSTLLIVFAATMATTLIHELGHGAVLTYYGGRPERIGFMLFYGMPSFFVDVSDGWRLPRAQQRVNVAFAGIATQLLISSVSPLIALGFDEGPLKTALLLFALATFFSSFINLVPFVKFDGYIALMTHLDLPNLRDRAMADARGAVARTLYGGRYERQLPGRSWVVPYGLACLAFPALLVLQAWRLWISSLSALGTVVTTVAALFVLNAVVRGVIKLIKRARTAGADPLRMVVVTAGVVAMLAAVAFSIQTPLRVETGFFTADDGEVHLIVPPLFEPDSFDQGQPVALYTRGLLGREYLGEAMIESTIATAGEGSITAVAPVISDGTPIPFDPTLVLSVASELDSPAGRAVVEFDEMSLPEWFATKYLGSPFTYIF